MKQGVLLMLGLAIASLIDRSTITSTGVVLPWVQGSLALSGDEAPLVTFSYNAALYSGILVSPWMLRGVGRVRFLSATIAVYGLAALLCAGSSSLHELVAARVLLGIAEGGIFLPSLLTIVSNVPDRFVPYFILIYGAVTQCATAFAPLLGGSMVETGSWRTLYGVLAVGAVTAAALIFTSAFDTPLDERLRQKRRAFDAGGAALLIGALTAYCYAAAYGPQRDWLNSADVVAAALGFVVTGAAFIWWELRGARYPIVPLAVLSQRNAWIGVALGLCIGFPMFGITEFVRYLQASLGFTLQIAGGLIALRAAALVFVVPLGTILIRRGVDSRVIVATGFVVSMCAFAWQGALVTSGSAFETFVGTELLVGVGFGLTFSPILNAVVSNVSFAQMPCAVVLMDLTFTLSGSFANAFLSTIYDQRQVKHMADVAGSATLSRPDIQNVLQQHDAGGLNALSALATQQAAALTFADIALFCASVAAIALPFTIFLRPAKHLALAVIPQTAEPR